MSSTTRRGRAIDLFAGWGGLSLGLEQAGFDISVSADDKPRNAEVHHRNFGYGRSLTLDLTEDRSRDIRRAFGSDDPDVMGIGQNYESIVDAVVGGPPCQGISQAGLKLADDPRNRLMVSFVDHVADLGARYGVMEQVPTLLGERNAGLLDELRELLHRRGYSMVAPRVLRAVDFGVPQRRERVFLLIHRMDQVAPVYPDPTHSVEPDFLLHATPTVADALDGLPDADDHPELYDRHWTPVGHPSPTSRYGMLMRGLLNDADDLSYRRVWDQGMLTCSQLTRHEPESVERFMQVKPGGSEPISRRHRLDPVGTSLTLRAGSDALRGSFTSVVPIHPKGSRVITVREAARLHGIPDSIEMSPVKILAYRQIGNSVIPAMGRAVGREIMRAAGLAPCAPTEVLDHRQAEAA
jgi:DNA (cytosine-5)-methyltransferase 1